MIVNRQFKLAERPVGLPTRDNWELIGTEVPQPGDGQFLVRNAYISLDPAMRGWMSEGKSYVPPVAIGEVMRACAVGRIEASDHPDFHVGDHVSGLFGVQDYAVSDGQNVQRIDPELAPLPAWLGVLGITGMTAYFALLETGEHREGDVVVVSGAAGAVGSTAGQIARIRGSRVVGIAGGPEKCRYVVDELGFDACVDYKAGKIRKALKQHCPDGVDLYFDNVGGDILDDVLTQIRLHARIVICGAISQYNNPEAVKGPSKYMALVVNRATMRGMVVFDHARRYGEAARDLAGWLKSGKLGHREHIVEGFENFPDALLMLFRGENFGKLVLKA